MIDLLKNIASLRILHGFKLSLPGFVGDELGDEYLVVDLVVITVPFVVGFDAWVVGRGFFLGPIPRTKFLVLSKA